MRNEYILKGICVLVVWCFLCGREIVSDAPLYVNQLVLGYV